MSISGSRRIVRGRDQIEGVWSVGLQGRDTEEERAIRLEIGSIRLLRDDLAQVDLVMVQVLRPYETGETFRQSMVVHRFDCPTASTLPRPYPLPEAVLP